MADDTRKDRDGVIPDLEPGTASPRDVGTTDSCANQAREKDFNIRKTGDSASRPVGPEAPVTGGPHVETDTRSGETETPGVKTRPQEAPIEKAE